VLIAYESSEWEGASDEVRDYYFAAHDAFSAYVAQHGTEHGSAALADADQATTVRRVGEAVSVTDGPFAETTEQLAGFYLVEAADLAEAIELGKQLPATTVEVRAIVPSPGM
jgi:hypothetical protein